MSCFSRAASVLASPCSGNLRFPGSDFGAVSDMLRGAGDRRQCWAALLNLDATRTSNSKKFWCVDEDETLRKEVLAARVSRALLTLLRQSHRSCAVRWGAAGHFEAPVLMAHIGTFCFKSAARV
jgi:hypothetical protein